MSLRKKIIPGFFIVAVAAVYLLFGRKEHYQDEPKPMSLQEFNEKTKNSKKAVLVYISAGWCSVCGKMKPVIAEVEKEYTDRVEVMRLDADRDKEVAEEFEIHSLPVMMLYHHGNREWIHVGILDKGRLKEKLNPYCWD